MHDITTTGYTIKTYTKFTVFIVKVSKKEYRTESHDVL